MATKTLQATTRQRTGSGVLNAMRREGFVPAVVYGVTENKNVKVHAKTFTDLLNTFPSSNILLTLEVEGAEQLVFIQDIQFDALSGKILHCDFLAVNDETLLTAKLPVRLLGEPAGAKVGGLLEQLVHSLKVKCLPGNLPLTIDADVSHLGLEETITVGDISFPEGVTPTLDGKVIVGIVAQTRASKSAGAEAK